MREKLFKSDRITLVETPEMLEVFISGKIPSWQLTALTVWLAAWSLLGIYVIAQFFIGIKGDQFIYMCVWLAFWLYFEYRGLLAWSWRRSGKEIFRVSGDKTELAFESTIGPRRSEFETASIGKFTSLQEQQGTFVKNHYESFWVVGGETIGFEYNGKLYSFGRQLPPDDAKALMQIVEKRISGKRRSANKS